MLRMKWISLQTTIKKVIRDYSEQFCTHKFDNLDEMSQCLEKHKLQLIQYELDNS